MLECPKREELGKVIGHTADHCTCAGEDMLITLGEMGSIQNLECIAGGKGV
jgi:hypothetical protein